MVFFVAPDTMSSVYIDVLVNEPGRQRCSIAGCIRWQQRVSVGFDYKTRLLQCDQIGDHAGQADMKTPSRPHENYWAGKNFNRPHVGQNRGMLSRDPQRAVRKAIASEGQKHTL